jgi:hypothetical protein
VILAVLDDKDDGWNACRYRRMDHPRETALA